MKLKSTPLEARRRWSERGNEYGINYEVKSEVESPKSEVGKKICRGMGAAMLRQNRIK